MDIQISRCIVRYLDKKKDKYLDISIQIDIYMDKYLDRQIYRYLKGICMDYKYYDWFYPPS